MLSNWKARVVVGIYIFLILSIPIGSYLASQRQNIESQANETKIENPIGDKLDPTTTAQQEIKNLINSKEPAGTTPTPTPSPTTAISFGPTLNFKLTLEGRPKGNQASKVFVGISLGTTSGKQTSYLLSFTIDLPLSGEYSGLSLAGLDVGKQYTAFIKPTAQIATSSAFIMSPSVTNLNSGGILSLLTGDLNEDNVINAADYNIAKAAYGSTPGTEKWNELADFNKDSVINNYDLGYIIKNMGTTGQSGPWQSSSSGGIEPSSSPSILPDKTLNPDGSEGYWLWVPR